MSDLTEPKNQKDPQQDVLDQEARQRDERRQELRRLARMLQNIVKTARDASLTGQLSGGKSVAIRQYHAILARLNALGVVDAELFPQLEDSASFDEVGFAASQLISFFQDEDEEQARKGWRNGGGVFEASPDHVKIVGFPGGIGELGDLLREHLPDFLRAKMGKVKEEAQKVGEQVREEVMKARDGVRDEAQKVREEAQKSRGEAQKSRDEQQRARDDERQRGREDLRQPRRGADPEIHLDFRGTEGFGSVASPAFTPEPPVSPTPPMPPSPPEPPAAAPFFAATPPVTEAPVTRASVSEPSAAVDEVPRTTDISVEIAGLAERMRQPGLPPEELGRLADEMGRLARRQSEACSGGEYRFN